MRGHRQDSAQKWGLPCRWLFLFFLGKNRCETDFVQPRSEVMVTSTTLKKLLSGGFTLGGLNVRIYRRTFSFGNLIFRNLSGEGLQIGPWMSELVKSSFFASQLNSRYRDGYDRHDTVKGTRESVNTPVKNHGQEQYRKCGVKENQEVITIPRLSKKAKREWSLFLDPRTGRRSYNELCRRCTRDCKQSFRSIVVACPHYESKRSTRCWNRTQITANSEEPVQ